MEKKYFKIEHILAQMILDYLSTKPYKEVYHIVENLQRLEPIPDSVDKPVPVKEIVAKKELEKNK